MFNRIYGTRNIQFFNIAILEYSRRNCIYDIGDRVRFRTTAWIKFKLYAVARIIDIMVDQYAVNIAIPSIVVAFRFVNVYVFQRGTVLECRACAFIAIRTDFNELNGVGNGYFRKQRATAKRFCKNLHDGLVVMRYRDLDCFLAFNVGTRYNAVAR